MMPGRRNLLLLFGSTGFKASDVTDIPASEAQMLINLYRMTAGPGWTDNTGWLSDPVANNWYGIIVEGGHVTQIRLYSNGLNGSVASFDPSVFGSLTRLYLYSTSVSGDISGWTLPASMAYLNLHSTSVSGDISGWTLPSPLVVLYLYSTSVSGDISGWTLPSSFASLQLDTTSVSAGPTPSDAIKNYQINDCALSQAAVDSIVQRTWNKRADFTYATPSIDVGGTNSAPSGTYQAANPPTTGKEYIHVLVNDDNSEGFNTWTITYTA